jgi:hypothetical protein
MESYPDPGSWDWKRAAKPRSRALFVMSAAKKAGSYSTGWDQHQHITGMRPLQKGGALEDERSASWQESDENRVCRSAKLEEHRYGLARAPCDHERRQASYILRALSKSIEETRFGKLLTLMRAEQQHWFLPGPGATRQDACRGSPSMHL